MKVSIINFVFSHRERRKDSVTRFFAREEIVWSTAQGVRTRRNRWWSVGRHGVGDDTYKIRKTP